MVVQSKLVTVEEFEAFIARPENAERLFELIDGEIVEKMPTQKHGVIAGNAFGFLWNYCRRSGRGRVAQEVRHRLPGDAHNARLPDIAFYADKSAPLIDRGPVPFLPDLAVEVQSPNDSYQRMRERADYYLANGARVVWLIYPAKHLIEVLTADDFEILRAGDTLTGGDLLPGFTLAVSDIFAE